MQNMPQHNISSMCKYKKDLPQYFWRVGISLNNAMSSTRKLNDSKLKTPSKLLDIYFSLQHSSPSNTLDQQRYNLKWGACRLLHLCSIRKPWRIRHMIINACMMMTKSIFHEQLIVLRNLKERILLAKRNNNPITTVHR